MLSCWQDNPDNRPTFETLYVRFDEFMIQAEPSYREVKIPIILFQFFIFSILFRRKLLSMTTNLSESIRYIYRKKNKN
jgi:hypothetical protein